MTWQEDYTEAFQQVFGTPLLNLVSGEGLIVRDDAGKDYLDLLGGIAVTCLGQNHPAITGAVTRQLQTLGHTSNFFTTPPQLALAAKLRTYLPGAKVFFANSGAEANEAALKLARKHRAGGGFVALDGSFHGRTMATLSVTSKAAYREPFAPLIEPVTFVPPEDIDALATAVTESTAALILEPIQGERGVVALSNDYLRAAREITAAAGALLIVDEIQSGTGRTGSFFAHSAAGITPDVVTLAKSLGGGIPIGAMLAVGEAGDLFAAGDHGTTFGGNPIACAAALAVIETIEEQDLMARCAEVGARWAAELAAIEGVAEVRGAGLLLGVAVADAPALQRELMEAGFITNAPNTETLRLAPSYLISDEQRAAFTSALRAALARRRR
ncbi:acetylornithine aminotransferase [Bowdeniella nasicola]|uniref:Acetylornithine aminotransferase n=1 Tax=Bowdeniella nasicola TaxID=208480 RepID=A0A1H4B3X3_9ACTO|nr:acetylornithine transaminase [Bowdeniella nasicola]SEA42885.1 acetylornithine aminotransferase [Bowdeniella nasicola]